MKEKRKGGDEVNAARRESRRHAASPVMIASYTPSYGQGHAAPTFVFTSASRVRVVPFRPRLLLLREIGRAHV